ncbi:hypothetical protein [Pontibacter harenae]|uniref:hypothetical protein n=1 Tax=Pontibacter harenae TaxID=2894083 RepID=UPI0034E2E904
MASMERPDISIFKKDFLKLPKIDDRASLKLKLICRITSTKMFPKAHTLPYILTIKLFCVLVFC